MFRRFGQKFIQGAKAEIEENGPNLDGILHGAAILFEGLLFAAIAFGGGKSQKNAAPSSVIVNNYIQKGE